MSLLDSKLYQLVERCVNFFLLNLLWLLACLPVITFIPATLAMFGVLRDWHMRKETNVLKPFIYHWRKNIKVSIGLTLSWLPLSGLLLANLPLLDPMGSIVNLGLAVLIGFMLILFSFTTVYLFPVVVHFDLPVVHLVRNAFFIATSQLKYTSLSVGVIVLAGYFIYQTPVLMAFMTSFMCYAIYVLCYEAFKNVGASYDGFQG
ncbi:DUF624 domain-containing protein [Salipaludibacillus agaradhaerens]|jgi:uncharacterized membrane protein YesL|uniref:YesL family protein n=1 Tax=Salipaludibacillus agaradhaerens TaxID=76935 RepID=UPI0021510362|nr:DUF624 domain-containing protein [Salipaludibacillus agaradhaerens]MCR6107505.1 DUF624 domain-containing protein [Salipaludibacillus agaradhaerens]MCR6119534.1 DUF624 domain-containing protein [Salipaludibacillus agaradhaerens]UJW58558.1 DUF624 domain-containing protein [Bacillus sp. A116_S68]